MRGMAKKEKQPKPINPPQQQHRRPGLESKMRPRPRASDPKHRGSGKLAGKVAIVTGGDSGIGRATCVAFAKEGADIACLYLNEHEDAKETQRLIRNAGRKCVLIAGDIGYESFCRDAVEQTVDELGRLDVLVNKAAEQHPQEKIEDIDREQLERTFRTNIFAMFFMTKAASKYLKKGSAIVNTASVTAYRGSKELLDYSSTKGAIVAFTRSLAKEVGADSIHVNCVAPGFTMSEGVKSHPEVIEALRDVSVAARTIKRDQVPEDVVGAVVFLCSPAADFVTGQTMVIDGGQFFH